MSIKNFSILFMRISSTYIISINFPVLLNKRRYPTSTYFKISNNELIVNDQFGNYEY